MNDVMSELEEIGAHFRVGDFRGGLEKLAAAWGQIPEPKADVPNAYLMIEYGVVLAFKLGDLDEAKKWALRAPLFRQKRQDRGEVEFLIGKVEFERGEFEAAKHNFIIAADKSKGRIFEGEDPKYRGLLAKRM